ncbi:hypothetical protein [Thermicanus aegyptius]|uniref:hypothetical protein n=1 Tax=Thermicanus aegyptius TaxID=94009 RepID=UPI0004903921|nr:hypothetical protein [Thermicanus aegyptius]
MFYLFMFLWFIFGVLFIGGLIYWLVRRKNGKFVLYSFIASSIFLIVGIFVSENESSPVNNLDNNGNKKAVVNVNSEDLKKQGLEFDEKAWNDYLKLYEAHGYLMKATNAFSEGSMSELDFYDYCKNAKEWFGQMSISFNYGKTDDEKEYLSTFEVFALADQSAVDSLMKYLDSNATKDLSNARENINRAKEAATIIAKNRIVLLNKIGLTEEEIATKKDRMIADLESIDKKVK